MDKNVKDKKDTSFKDRIAYIIGLTALATAILLFVIFNGTTYDYGAAGEERVVRVASIKTMFTGITVKAAEADDLDMDFQDVIEIGGTRFRVREDGMLYHVREDETILYLITIPRRLYDAEHYYYTRAMRETLRTAGVMTIRYFPNSANRTVWINPPYAPYSMWVEDDDYVHDYDAVYIEVTGRLGSMYWGRYRGRPECSPWVFLIHYRPAELQRPGAYFDTAELLLGIAILAPFAIIPLILLVRVFMRMSKFRKDIVSFKDKKGVDPSFEQIYQQLSDKHRPQLDAMRKSIILKLLLMVGICAAVVILPFVLFDNADIGIAISAVGGPFMLIGFFLLKDRLKRPYVDYFRENMAKSFVALVDSKLSYSPEPSDKQWEQIVNQYHIAAFEGSVFGSQMLMEPTDTIGAPGLSNYVTGRIEGRPFQMCCMFMTSNLRNDPLKFKGLFINMKVSRNLQGFIKIERKVGRGAIKTFRPRYIPKRERKKLDSPAFERDFRVGSDDQVTAMRYLTADVMELLIDYKNELLYTQTRFNRNLRPQNTDRISLDFFWQGNEVMMRVGNKKMFRPTLRDPMCKDSLACCYSSLAFAARLNHVITKSIKDTSI